MPGRIYALVAIAAAVLSTAISAAGGSAAEFGSPPRLAVQHAAVVCGPWGCAPTGRVRHHRPRNWDRPWGTVAPPACPLGYYFACRRGPLGYGACACWPYRWH